MPYAEIYSHKQDMQSASQGANQGLSMTQSPTVDAGLSTKGVIGIMAIERQLAPVFKQSITSYVSSTGDAKLARNIGYIGSIIGFGVTAATVGLPVALGVAAISITTNLIGNQVQERLTQMDQDYNVKVRGAKVNSYVSRGGYYG